MEIASSRLRRHSRIRDVSVAVIVLLAGLGLVGISGANAAERVSSPSNFVVDYGGDIASDQNRLFLTVTGWSKKGGVRTQVFAKQGAKWRAVSRQFPSTYRGSNNVYFLRFPGVPRLVPCFSYVDREGEGQFRCRSGKRWRQLKVAASLRKMDYFLEANATHGRLTAFFQSVARPNSNKKLETTKVRIGERRGWRIVPRGPMGVFQCRCSAAIGQQTRNSRSPLVDVAMNALYTTRFVATLGPNGWRRSKPLPPPIRPSIVGSQFGSVRTGRDLLVPVHTISWEEPWTLSVYGNERDGSWSQVGGRNLNLGAGNTQGAILPIGNRVWAMWEEYPVDGTDDPTSIHVARINRAGTDYDRTIKLWTGPFGFMTGYDAIEHKGGPVFIYTRSYESDDRLAHLVVDMSHVDGRQASSTE